MATITEPEAASRLAKALVADVRLYHDAALRAGSLPAEVVDEARALFRARVDPSMHGVLESAFADLRAQFGLDAAPDPVSRAPASQASVPSPRSHEVPAVASPDDDLRRILLAAVALALLLIVVAALMAYLVL